MDTATGIALVVAGVAAIALGSRKKSAPATDTGGGDGDSAPQPGDDGSGADDRGRTGQLDPNWSLRNAICKRPLQLTAAENRSIIEKLIAPAYDARASELPRQPTPTQLDTFLGAVSRDVLSRCTPSPSMTSIRIGSELARALWWQRTGQSGQ